MLRIVKHIKRLLIEHDCVIVPNLGGFVIQRIAATIDSGSHVFSPSRKEIIFNETLQYNDGLLIGSYMAISGCDYATAQQLVNDDVLSLKESLKETGRISLDKVGDFILGGEEQIIFQAGDSEWLNAETFGLSAFTFSPLSDYGSELSAHNDKTDRRDVYYIPINRRFVQVVAAAVIALVMFLGTSISVKDVNRSSYTASFVPSEMVSVSLLQSEKHTEPIPASEENREKDLYDKAVNVQSVSTTDTEAVGQDSPKPLNKTEKTVKQKRYNIIIGSFPIKAQAEQFMHEVDVNSYPNMSILFKDGKYRICADYFTERGNAEKYMANLRENTKYKDAWLFVCR